MIAELEKYHDFPAVPVTIQFKVESFAAIQVINSFRKEHVPCFLLTRTNEKDEKYTYLGISPQRSYQMHAEMVTINTPKGQQVKHKVPFSKVLEQVLAKYQTPHIPELPPFLGGLAGYFSYDYAKTATSAHFADVTDPLELPDADLLLLDQVIVYDHRKKEITLSRIVSTQITPTKYRAVLEDLRTLKEKILHLHLDSDLPTFSMGKLKMHFSLAEFEQHVEEVRRRIKDGDIFQLILSNMQETSMRGSLLAVAPRLFTDCPSPYEFYFQHADFEVVGASPETLVGKNGQQLFAYPLAGTRRRGATAAQDAAFAQELYHDPKELSEHNMLIDLGRNDLGRVSKFGTVQVTGVRKLLKFANVMHLGSTIESTVAPKTTATEIVKAVLPAGTLSGAPKISAMQIIAQLEKRKRGLYGGCLGYLGFDGDLDMCIGIRLAYRKAEHLVVHSGAGIVADSVAKHEYQEFNNKAAAVKKALAAVNTTEEVAVDALFD